MQYSFDKYKLPKSLGFPLKRSILDSMLDNYRIQGIHRVYYWRRNGKSGIFLRADFCGEDNRQFVAKGTSSITLYAVSTAHMKTIQNLIMNEALPILKDWLLKIQNGSNVIRSYDHEITFELFENKLKCQER